MQKPTSFSFSHDFKKLYKLKTLCYTGNNNRFQSFKGTKVTILFLSFNIKPAKNFSTSGSSLVRYAPAAAICRSCEHIFRLPGVNTRSVDPFVAGYFFLPIDKAKGGIFFTEWSAFENLFVVLHIATPDLLF
jgi:hypothetical protein